MASTAKFWDKIAERYAKKPIADENAYQEKLQLTRQYLNREMEVFEFGCGTGSTALLHASSVKHIYATDISAKMIEIAKRKAALEKISNVTFEQTSFEDITPKDSSFDVVLGLSILHLLDNKEAAIAKVYRMLKPGGVFVTSTACIADTMRLFKIVAPIGRFFGLIPFVSVFTTRELLNALTHPGFKIDYQWQPAKGKGVFIVAKKPDLSRSEEI